MRRLLNEEKNMTDKQKKIDYHCKDCGEDVENCMRIQNETLAYVKCLTCGLGAKRSKNQPS